MLAMSVCPQCGRPLPEGATSCACSQPSATPPSYLSAPPSYSSASGNDDANVKLPYRPEIILALSLFSFVCCGVFTAIPAAVMGGRTVKFIDREAPRHPGRGLAKAGQILGIVGTITGIFVCLPVSAAIIFPVLAQARLAKKKTDLLKEGVAITRGLALYSEDYDDRLPLGSQWSEGTLIVPYAAPKVRINDFVYTFSGNVPVTAVPMPGQTPLGHLPGALIQYNRSDVVSLADWHTKWMSHEAADRLVENNLANEVHRIWRTTIKDADGAATDLLMDLRSADTYENTYLVKLDKTGRMKLRITAKGPYSMSGRNVTIEPASQFKMELAMDTQWVPIDEHSSSKELRTVYKEERKEASHGMQFDIESISGKQLVIQDASEKTVFSEYLDRAGASKH